jgi:UDP-glucose 4-epimerase
MAATFLLTGGAGFVGSHLTDSLVADGHRVIVLDDLSVGSRENLSASLASGLVEVVEATVLDRDVVDHCMGQVDVCVHLAARLGVERIVSQPLSCLRENVLGADVVMEAAARHGRRLLFSSSSEVYGKLNQRGLTEDADRLIGAPAKSRWSYAIAKAYGESLAHAHVSEGGAEMIVVRLFNTVGPRQSGKYGMVVPRFVHQALSGEPLTVYGDGAQTRCFTDVRDVVRAIRGLIACDDSVGGAFNIGSSTSVRVVDLARLVIDRTASVSGVVFVPYAQAHSPGFEELGNRSPDTLALRSLTGWRPRWGLEQTIDSVVSHALRRALGVRCTGGLSADSLPAARERVAA